MKTIGISIDGVIRNYIGAFDKQYRKTYIFNPNIVEMDEEFKYKEPTEEDLEKTTKRIQEETKKRISLPVDTYDLLNHYQFYETPEYNNKNAFVEKKSGEKSEDLNKILTPEEALYQFMYVKYPFQIFGDSEEYQNEMSYFNQLQGYGIRTGLFKTVLLSNLKGNAITANYFFLHKTGSRAKNIIIVDDDINKWDFCDVLIDVAPESLQNKPNGKISIKINRPYNQWDDADFSVNSLKDVKDEMFLNNLFK